MKWIVVLNTSKKDRNKGTYIHKYIVEVKCQYPHTKPTTNLGFVSTVVCVCIASSLHALSLSLLWSNYTTNTQQQHSTVSPSSSRDFHSQIPNPSRDFTPKTRHSIDPRPFILARARVLLYILYQFLSVFVCAGFECKFDMVATVKVKSDKLRPCMTCPLCRKLFKDATTISLCLHTCSSLLFTFNCFLTCPCSLPIWFWFWLIVLAFCILFSLRFWCSCSLSSYAMCYLLTLLGSCNFYAISWVFMIWVFCSM